MLPVFPAKIEFKVRGYELDLMGHVNNAVYMNWLEHSRWELLATPEGMSLFGDTLTVVRAAELNYQGETRLGDTVRISTWPRHVGQTSFTLGSCIRVIDAHDKDRVGNIALLAKTVMTCVKPGFGKVAVPDTWRAHFPTADIGDTLPTGV